MVRRDEIRAGERAVEWGGASDACLIYIGRIHTPWTLRMDCPRQGRHDGPACRIEVFQPWAEALEGIVEYKQLEVLYWLHRSRRDLVLQSPRDDGTTRGAFALRTPVRPNPIGTSIVTLIGIDGTTLLVRGIDCLDGTPLLDIKPDRSQFTPLAPPTKGDFDVGDT
jgi:tRNA-Thr(GGU) m(6)t(6)A37 methyltransferase TsaA